MKTPAPAGVRPGAVAEVVGVRTIDSEALARQFEAPLGTQVYLIEFGDGQSVEVAEPLLESSLEH